jgi:MYXO-CTERM domain-containing protein
MKHKQSLVFIALLPAWLFAIASCEVCCAAAFSTAYGDPNFPITTEPDNYYKQADGSWDGISTIFHAPVVSADSTATLKASIYGRHYDSDPVRPGEWGLLDRAKLTGLDSPPWLIKHGLAPEFKGSKDSYSDVNGVYTRFDASYISFEIELATNRENEQLLFDNVQLSIEGFYNTDGDVDIWAASNQDNFGNPVLPAYSVNLNTGSDVITFDFGTVDLYTKKLEVRIYGAIGLDQGTFGITTLTGDVVPVPLPEPGTAGLGLLVLGGLGARRRRASGGVSHFF